MDAKRKPGVFSLIAAFLAGALISLLAAALFAALSSLVFHTALPPFTGMKSRAVSAEERKRITVVIDPGHGGMDPGAISETGIREKDLNLVLAKKLRFLLESEGVNVLLTREEDEMLTTQNGRGNAKTRDLLARVEAGEQAENAVFVSLHMNALPIEKYRGLQVFYSPNDARSRVLAKTLQSKTAEFLEPDNKREIKEAGSNIFILDRLNVPAVLVECGFLSNREEAELLASEDFQNRLSVTLAVSILQFIGEEGEE